MGENLQVLVIDETGRSTLLSPEETIPGLNISMRGSNNIIKIHKPFKFINSAIRMDCKDSCIEIGANSICNSLTILNNGGYENRNLNIGKNFACWGCEILLNGRKNSVCIGDNCVFSKEIHIMNGDGHLIWSTNCPPPL